MERVTAVLDITVNVDCPNCGNYINLLDEIDTNGENLNEDGMILKQACPNGYWNESHDKFKVDRVTCSECKCEFTVKGLEW